MRQTLDRFITLLLRFLLPVTALTLPLFFLPITTEFFLINKNLLLLVVGSLALIVWLVRNIVRRRIQISLTPATIPLLLLAIVYLASSFLSKGNLYMNLMGRTAIIISLTSLYIATTSSQKNRQIIDYTIAALILSASLASLLSLYAFLGLNAALPAPSWLTAKTFNPVGGPIPLLTFIAPILPMALFLVTKNRAWHTRVGLLFASGFIIAAIISQISLLIPSSGNQIYLLPVAAGWSIAVDIFKDWQTALFGVGPEGFVSAFSRLRPAFLNQTNLWDVRFNSSSNEFFTVLTTVGLLGLLCYLFAIIRTLHAGVKNLTREKTDLIAGTLLLFGTALANFFVPANPTLLGLGFISLTLVALSLKTSSAATKDVALNISANSTEASIPLLPWLISLILIPILGYFWYWQGRAYAANLATYQAMANLGKNATESYNQQIRAYNLESSNPYYRLNFAQTSLSLANAIAGQKDLSDQDKTNITQLIQQAIREAKNATQLDPENPLVWENLANTYRQLIFFAEGAADWALASYLQAISLDPTNPRLHLELGGIYFSLKDLDNAARQYELAIGLKPNWANAHYNLAAVHKAKKDYAKALAEMRVVIQLLDPNGNDYQTAQNELKDLERLVPGAVAPTETSTGDELTQPLPLPSGKPQVELPADSAPNLPTP